MIIGISAYDLGFLEDSIDYKEVLVGTYISPPKIDKYVKALLKELI